MIQVTRDGGKTWTKTDKFPERARHDVREPRRLVEGQRRNDLRHARRTSQQRLQAVRREEHRLRQDVDVDHRRSARRRIGAGDSRASAATESAVRRHRVRRVLHDRRRRHWTQLKSGIPGVPVHDMQIQARANDLVSARTAAASTSSTTSRRSSSSRKRRQAPVAFLYPMQDALLFQPNTSRVSGMGSRGFTGQNPDPGPRVSYLLNAVSADAKLSLSDCRRSRNDRARAAGEQAGRHVSHDVGHARWSAAHRAGGHARAAARGHAAARAAAARVAVGRSRMRRVALVVRAALTADTSAGGGGGGRWRRSRRRRSRQHTSRGSREIRRAVDDQLAIGPTDDARAAVRVDEGSDGDAHRRGAQAALRVSSRGREDAALTA